ncbi:hypothetical protein BC936DRAFT_142048 [Jimgerdemannia flammicorona]|uniref:Uncharacterized protein n=1 Tax=Jimgerdemannia flammicorona TaxID=994334 RepID=A0A433A197_9FUNG|nr:hypothetical protein BC936DRAFT_142048 [Jimgerdemannia flammicorona]
MGWQVLLPIFPPLTFYIHCHSPTKPPAFNSYSLYGASIVPKAATVSRVPSSTWQTRTTPSSGAGRDSTISSSLQAVAYGSSPSPTPCSAVVICQWSITLAPSEPRTPTRRPIAILKPTGTKKRNGGGGVTATKHRF